MPRTAWNTVSVAPAAAPVSLAHLMLQEMEEQKALLQEQADHKLAMSLQEPLPAMAPAAFQPGDADFDDLLAQALAESAVAAVEDPDTALARRLQVEYDAAASTPQTFKGKGKAKESSGEEDDYLVALRMQAEFDKDFNRQISAVERYQNAGSKIQVSLKNFKLAEYPSGDEEDEPLGAEVDDDERIEYNRVALSGMNSVRTQTGAGPKKKRSSATTKHDLEADSIKNARRMERLPALEIGNAGRVKDLRLPYKVFNSLKNHASKASGRQNARNKTRLFDKDDYSTQDSVLDKRTRLLLLQFVNKEIIEEIDGVINTGKEANVYYATAVDNWVDMNEADDAKEAALQKKKQKKQKKARRQGEDEDYKEEEEEENFVDLDEDSGEYTVSECALKIFKTTLQEFKNREEYIRDDSRYVNRLAKHNSRKLINLWAEKEMLNLGRMNRAGIPCPEVLHHEGHILVLSFLGKDKKPAPTLKDAGKLLSPGRREVLYEQCIKGMRTMYQVARLVHADLSEYNLLYHNQALWFIDVSQAVEREHPNAHTFLFRDCCNVTRFFRSIGVEGAMSPLELFSFVISDSLASSVDDETLTEEIRQFVQERLGEGVEVSVHDPHLEEVLNKLLPSYLEEDALKQLGTSSEDDDDDAEETEEISEENSEGMGLSGK